MIRYLTRLWHRVRCARGRHEWTGWWWYQGYGPGWASVERGETRVCVHCPEQQYRHVVWEEITVEEHEP